MDWYKQTLMVQTRGKGLYPITDLVNELIRGWNVREGMCYLFVQHTSASLLISESYDPTARIDLEAFFERVAPENQAWHRHTLEGPDDSPSHMRAAITQTSETIPLEAGSLHLGTWQGIYLFEHRTRGHRRKVLVRVLGVA